MEPLEAEAAVVDDFLLNFSEDLFLDHDSSSSSMFQHSQSNHHQQHHKAQAGPAQQQQQQQAEQHVPRILPDDDPFLKDFPPVEGELDWMTSSRRGFPSFEFIPVAVPSSASRPPKKKPPPPPEPGRSGGEPKRPSPVSVLEAAGGNLWPVRKRSKARQRLRAVLPVFRADQQPPPPPLPPATPDGIPRRRCWHCGAEETPQWRAGPTGPKTLCNACGVRYKSGRLVPEYRPASSPTFSSELHSNSHRKIIEMRRRKAATDWSGPPIHPSPLGPPAAALTPPPAVAKMRRKKKEEDTQSGRVPFVSLWMTKPDRRKP